MSLDNRRVVHVLEEKNHRQGVQSRLVLSRLEMIKMRPTFETIDAAAAAADESSSDDDR